MLQREDESGCNIAKVVCVCAYACVLQNRERELETKFNVKEIILPTN